MRILSRLLSLALTAAALIFPAAVHAQNSQNHTTNVTLTNLVNIPTARICAVGVDANNNSITFSETGWGLITDKTPPFCAITVANALPSGLNLPDACNTNASSPLRYTFTIQALSSGLPIGIPAIIPSVPNVCTSTYSLDNYTPTTSVVSPQANLIGFSPTIPSTCVAPSVLTLPSGSVYSCRNGVFVLVAAGTFNLRGPWSAGTAYTAYDIVSYNGISYVRVSGGTTSTSPDVDTANWYLLASSKVALPAGVQCEFIFAGGSGSTWPATVGSYTATLGTGGQAPAWVQGGLSFTAASNTFASVPAGCLSAAKTILLVYTTDVGQMNTSGNGFGPIVSSDAQGTFINVPPSGPQQGPGFLMGANPVFTSTDRISGTVAASLTFDASAPSVYINGTRISAGNVTPANGTPASFPATTTTWLGNYQGSGPFAWGGVLSAVIAFSTELTPAQQQQAYESIRETLAPYSVFPIDRTDYSLGFVAGDGDSVTETSVCSYQYRCAIRAQAIAMLGLNIAYVNFGKGGAATADLLTAYPTKVAPFFAHFGASPRVLMLEGGINDIAHGVTDPNVIFTNQYQECALAVSQGAVCTLTTVPPNEAFDSTHETERQSYNHLIINSVLNGAVPAVAVSDWAGDPIMGNLNTPSNATYYSDGTHPTVTGAPYFARYDALALHRALNPTQQYWMKVSANPVAFVGINAATYTMPLLQLMPKEKVCGLTPRVTTAFAATSLTALTFTTGNSLGTATTYGGTFNAFAAGNTDYAGPLNIPEKGIVQAIWTATGGNLSAITAGNVDFDICLVTQP